MGDASRADGPGCGCEEGPVSDQAADIVDLSALAADAADGLEDVRSRAEGDGTTYARAGIPYARVRADRLEVRLPDDILEAALRTPDTTRAERGWIRFSPTTADRHVTDRAGAWLLTAWRHAADD